MIYAEGLRVGTRTDVAVAVMPGEVLVVDGPPGSGKTGMLLTLAGRLRLTDGLAKTAGLVLPEQAGPVRRRTAYLDVAAVDDLERELAAVRRSRPRVLFVDGVHLAVRPQDRAALAAALDEVADRREAAVVLSTRDRAAAEALLAGPYRLLSLRPSPAPALAQA